MIKIFILAGFVVPILGFVELLPYMPTTKLTYVFTLVILSIINSFILFEYYRERFNLDKQIDVLDLPDFTLRNVAFYDQVTNAISVNLLHNDIILKNAKDLTKEDKEYARDTIEKYIIDNDLDNNKWLIKIIIDEYLSSDSLKRPLSNMASYVLIKKGSDSFYAKDTYFLVN